MALLRRNRKNGRSPNTDAFAAAWMPSCGSSKAAALRPARGAPRRF